MSLVDFIGDWTIHDLSQGAITLKKILLKIIQPLSNLLQSPLIG